MHICYIHIISTQPYGAAISKVKEDRHVENATSNILTCFALTFSVWLFPNIHSTCINIEEISEFYD